MRKIAVVAPPPLPRVRVTHSLLRLVDGRALLELRTEPATGTPVTGTLFTDAAMTQPLRQLEVGTAPIDLGPLEPATTYYLQLRSTVPRGAISSEPLRMTVTDAWGLSVFEIGSPVTPAP